MKLEFLFSRIATLAVFVTTIGLAADVCPLAFFAGAAGALILLVAAGDYTRRSSYAFALAKVPRDRATLPLAA